MAIQILPASEPVKIDHVIVTVYGDPGAGKSSLAFTASRPLTLDFDNGAYRSEFRKDIVQIQNWSDVVGMTAEDLAPYDTVVVDTVGRALDVMSADIIKGNAKMGRGDGQLSLQGFGALKSHFASWMKLLRSHGKDVVLIAHGKEDRSGDDIVLRPDVTGSSYGEILKVADGVAYLHMIGKKRTLEFDPSERFIGKNPANLPAEEIPSFYEVPDYFAGLLARTKAAMGQISAEGKAIAETVAEHREVLAGIKTCKALTEFLAVGADIEPPAAKIQVKHLLFARAEELGFAWDKAGKKFVKAKTADKPADDAATDESQEAA